ncbi:hypothetical protein EII29_00680 [Leptotrichia sp. OH3620_COT-345]|uniref:hypothetical protein n=1 Tax=Leptotrichia sp. OH3620_COT-345 TaxID=2491048 RepID=UPI000F6498C9|nr:hypothetical protein [Leptotrichia sp. OH3620_COT-345]RRD41000.1 hypothetical protein EII29_00680 [Leptotrichia sp. OH3620_COT-345]
MKEDAFDNSKINRIFLKSDKETDKNINFIQKILRILSFLMYWKALGSFQLVLNIRKEALLNIEVSYQSVIFTVIEGVLFLITGFQLGKIFENIKMMLNTEKKVLNNEIIFGKVIFILKILIMFTILAIILTCIRISEIINYIMTVL